MYSTDCAYIYSLKQKWAGPLPHHYYKKQEE